MCPIAARNGSLIPGNCDATGKCVAVCRSLEGGKCGDGFEWKDSQLIANESFCRLGECQDVECEPIDISDASQCCFNSPYCVPENNGVGKMPLPYKCQATPPVCLKLGDVCREDNVDYDYSYGDCCGNYCSYSDTMDDKDLDDAKYDKYTCQENQVFKRG